MIDTAQETPILSSAVAPAACGGTQQMRPPSRKDGAALHRLISECPPLDLNSLYAYLLLAEHFSDTCVLAESAGGRIDGFISAYVLPDRPDVLFVWQVAVHAAHAAIVRPRHAQSTLAAQGAGACSSSRNHGGA